MTVEGKHIRLRTVNIEDGEFIYNLRNNQKKTKYLSQIKGTVEDQKKWIQDYKHREKNNQEYYFVIESKRKEKLGLVRIYDFQNDSFSWGSWLLKDSAPAYAAIESALQIYEFAFHHLDFTRSHFEVQKGNDRVKAFHLRFGAEIINENENEFFFIFTKRIYETARIKYKRYL